METHLQKMKDEWAQLICDTDTQVCLLAAGIAGQHAKARSQKCYNVVLSDSQAADFFMNERGERPLKSALRQRFIDLFSCHSIDLAMEHGDTVPHSLSIGAAMLSGLPDDERLIQLADEARYGAKRRGRIRVELWKALC